MGCRRASRTVRGSGSQPNRRPRRVTAGAPAYPANVSPTSPGLSAPTGSRSSSTARSASGAARSRRCSDSSTVVPRSSRSRATAARTSSAPCGSSWLVGSSSARTAGPVANAPAIAQRWRSPPDRLDTARSWQVGDPHGVEHLLHAAPHGQCVDTEVLEREGDIAFHVIDDRVGIGVLMYEPDYRGEVPRTMGARRAAVNHDLATKSTTGSVRDQAVDATQQGALARSRRPGHE